MMWINIDKVKHDLEEKYKGYLSGNQLLDHCERWNKLVRSATALHYTSIEPDTMDVMIDRLMEKMNKERIEILNITKISKFFDIEIELVEVEIKLTKADI